MADSHSISTWLEQVKRGDEEAARRLWERYFPRLVSLARQKLAGVPRKIEDEEDVALSAFASFCEAADMGRFPHLSDRQGLWRLLCRILHCKAVDLIRRSLAAMGDAKVLDESCLVGSATSHQSRGAQLVPVESPADFAVVMADEVRRLFNMLPEEELRIIAAAKMEGDTNRRIAKRLGCAERTIERRLKYIRAIWKREYRSGT
jgi:DNA-directed RNA polymerase specialized sigma24 family protein